MKNHEKIAEIATQALRAMAQNPFADGSAATKASNDRRYLGRRTERMLASIRRSVDNARRKVGMKPSARRAESRWNDVVPDCALNVEFFDGGVCYLHPTKGRRTVSMSRLTAAPPGRAMASLFMRLPRVRGAMSGL